MRTKELREEGTRAVVVPRVFYISIVNGKGSRCKASRISFWRKRERENVKEGTTVRKEEEQEEAKE